MFLELQAEKNIAGIFASIKIRKMIRDNDHISSMTITVRRAWITFVRAPEQLPWKKEIQRIKSKLYLTKNLILISPPLNLLDVICASTFISCLAVSNIFCKTLVVRDEQEERFLS